jgi:hypothetical protein
MIALTTGNLVAVAILMPTYVEFRILESLMSHNDVRRKRTRGQVMLLVTVALIPMLGLVGLVSDIGYMQYIQNSAQTAADAAARSAAARFNSTIGGANFTCGDYPWICHVDPWTCPADLTSAADPIETACLYAKQNGFYTNNANQNVTIVSNVTATPPTAPGVNTAGWWITVRVAQRVPQLFSAALGNRTGLVAARSTAAVTPATACVYVLDPTGTAAYYQNGSTTFSSACGIYVDSNSPTAMQNSGNAIVQASEYQIVGGIDWHGTITPNPTTGVAPFPDPLRNLPVPSPCSTAGGCDSADCSAHPNQTVINSDVTLSPGTYCGGIKVKNATVTFSPGQYFIVGGGISTQDSNSHIRGSNVFFYNTYNSTKNYGTFDFNANSDVQLTAPTSGTYTGILAFQDRACCAAGSVTESFQGGATSFYEGTIYYPKSIVNFKGNPSLDIAHYTIIVSWHLAIQGSSYMNNDYSHLVGGNPIKQVGLIE